MNKKAYFFIIDAILALLVLSVGIGLVLTITYKMPAKTQSEFLSFDLMKPLNKKIRGGIPGDRPCGSNGDYEQAGIITHPENTVLTQLAEFYYRQEILEIEDTSDYMFQCVNDSIPLMNIEHHNLAILIDNFTIFENSTVDRYNETVKVRIPSRKVVFGFFNETFYGPYMAEVWVWR